MGYLHKRYGRGRRGNAAMGGLFDTISNLVSGGQTAINLASDPYAPEVLCRIQQIQAASAGQAVKECVDTASTANTALGRFIIPLRMVAFAEQNRWAYFVAAVAVIGLPLWIGYRLGSRGGS